MPRIPYDPAMVRLVSANERAARTARLRGNPAPIPAPTPPLIIPTVQDFPKLASLVDLTVVERCEEIFKAVCASQLCGPTEARDTQRGLSECVRSRRLTAYIARTHLQPPADYETIGQVTGDTKQNTNMGLNRIREQLVGPFLKRVEERIVSQLRQAGVLPSPPPTPTST